MTKLGGSGGEGGGNINSYVSFTFDIYLRGVSILVVLDDLEV